MNSQLFKLGNDAIYRPVTLEQNDYQIEGNGLYVLANLSPGKYIEGQIIKEGISVSFHPFNLEQKLNYSSAKGRWASMVETSNDAIVDLLSPCGTLIDQKNLINPSAQSSDIIIEIDSEESGYSIVNTRVLDCDANIVSEAGVRISNDQEEFFYVFNEGKVNSWIPVCKETFGISAFGVNDFQASIPLAWSTSFQDDINYLVDCDDFDTGFSFISIQDEIRLYNSFVAEIGDEETRLRAQDDEFRIKFKGLEIRNYNVNEVNLFIDDPLFGDSGYGISCENSALGCGIDKFNVTHFSQNQNEWIRVNFEGVIWAQTLNPPVAGNYSIKGVIMTLQ